MNTLWLKITVLHVNDTLRTQESLFLSARLSWPQRAFVPSAFVVGFEIFHIMQIKDKFYKRN